MNLLRYRAPHPTDGPWRRRLFVTAAPGREFLPAAVLEEQERLQRAQWQARWGAGETVVEYDGAPVARLWLAASDAGLRLVDVTVAPAARGHGLGRRLLTDLCEAADAAGWSLQLAVAVDNTVARRLYASLGFVVSGPDTAEHPLTLQLARPALPHS